MPGERGGRALRAVVSAWPRLHRGTAPGILLCLRQRVDPGRPPAFPRLCRYDDFDKDDDDVKDDHGDGCGGGGGGGGGGRDGYNSRNCGDIRSVFLCPR